MPVELTKKDSFLHTFIKTWQV